ncbi:MAG: ferredoxin [Sporomusa sp.]|jgi:2-oxoglutarate ferredoxin oxidoreductase subunit delta|nr:ferredoxin [Sporomusa sp.]
MVEVENDRCKSCGVCVAFCPTKCLRITDKINAKGYKVAGHTDEEKCISCGICFQVCPDTAISVFKK